MPQSLRHVQPLIEQFLRTYGAERRIRNILIHTLCEALAGLSHAKEQAVP
jgi:hypothetical protein